MDVGGFSLDQLMELAGISVSQAGEYMSANSDRKTLNYILQVYRFHPRNAGKKVLVVCGPGNNGISQKDQLISYHT
jgi:NAD(P)H-hydrate epimerase